MYMYFPISTPIIIILQMVLAGLWIKNSMLRSRLVEKMYLTPDLLHIVNVYQSKGIVGRVDASNQSSKSRAKWKRFTFRS